MKKLSYLFSMLMLVTAFNFTACKDDPVPPVIPDPDPDPEECILNTESIEQKAGFYTIIMQSPEEICEAYFCGSLTENGWAQNENTKMTDAYTLEAAECEGIYWIYYVDETLIDGSLQFKFCAGPSWAYEEKIGANRDYDETTTIYEVVNWASVLCGDEPVEGTATFTLKVPECTPADAVVSIVGDFPNFAWAPTAEQGIMKKNEDGTYSITLDVPASLPYKYAINTNTPEAGADGWGFVEMNIDADGYAVDLDNNRILATTDEVKIVNDEVKSWKNTGGCAAEKPAEE